MKLLSKSIVKVTNEVPVYDIEVKSDYHNFQLASGNFVHNCTNALASEFYEFSNLACATVSKAPEYLQKFIKTWIKDNPNKYGYYFIKYNKGYKSDEGVMDFNDILKLLELPDNAFGDDKPSTITAFYPDMDIFKSSSAKIPVACKFVKKMNLNKKLHFYINGIENLDEVPDYGYNLNVRCNNPATGIEASKNPWIDFVVSFGIAEKLTDTEYVASVNGLDTQGGKHLRMVRNAYCNAFKSVFGSCVGKEDLGINFMIIMSCYEPVFSSQTKETLYDVPGFNFNSLPSLEKAFKKIINDNKDVFEQNYLRIIQYLDSMNALGKLGKIKAKVAIASEAGAKSAIYTPIKLKDCSSKDRRRCELYLTEGDSAGSTLLMGRDPSIHAVLPLRGKCKNTVNMDIVDVLDNNEMYDIINSIGTGVDDHHDLSEVRYGKIILAADADPDGAQINALLLGVFMSHLSYLLDAGMVYIAEMPLFAQDGKFLFKSDGSYKQLNKNKPFSRFKGLGEMDVDELSRCLFDPTTRRLLRVKIDDKAHASATLTSAGARRELMINRGILSEIPYTTELYEMDKEIKLEDSAEMNIF